MQAYLHLQTSLQMHKVALSKYFHLCCRFDSNSILLVINIPQPIIHLLILGPLCSTCRFKHPPRTAPKMLTHLCPPHQSQAGLYPVSAAL